MLVARTLTTSPALSNLPRTNRPAALTAATGQMVAALEARLAEYPGDEDVANGETWI